jgi:glutamine cyclotransferase
MDGANPVTRLNELECVDGAVYANVWLTDDLVRIDPASGAVTAWIDAAALVPAGAGPDDVLNGIAHDPTDDTFLLTGKRWPDLYRVSFTTT